MGGARRGSKWSRLRSYWRQSRRQRRCPHLVVSRLVPSGGWSTFVLRRPGLPHACATTTEAAPSVAVLDGWAPRMHARRATYARCDPLRTPPAPKFFHNHHVTSDLVARSNLRDHGRGRDGRANPQRRAPKSFASQILVSKFFDIRILPGISC